MDQPEKGILFFVLNLVEKVCQGDGKGKLLNELYIEAISFEESPFP